MQPNPAKPRGPDGRPIAAVIFDLDGTLVDSAGEICVALEAAFVGLGLRALPYKSVESLIGRGVRSLVERGLQQTAAATIDVDTAVAAFEQHYAGLVGTRATLFPGARDALETLSRHGVPMSVVTNKPRFFTEQLLLRLDVIDLFHGIVAGDDGIARKPAGDMLIAACHAMASEPPATLMLGDSDNDIVAARNAGCPVWCVPYGYNEGRPPETLACDRLVASLEEAARLVLESRA